MKSKLFLLILVAIVFSSCKINKNISVLQSFPYYTGEIKIIYSEDKLPENSVLVAMGTFDEGSTTKCESCQVANYLKFAIEDSRTYGANIILVTRIEKKGTSYYSTSIPLRGGMTTQMSMPIESCCYRMSVSYYFAK